MGKGQVIPQTLELIKKVILLTEFEMEFQDFLAVNVIASIVILQ